MTGWVILDPEFRWPDNWTPALWVNHAGAILWCPVPASLPLPSELRLILEAWTGEPENAIGYTSDWHVVGVLVNVLR